MNNFILKLDPTQLCKDIKLYIAVCVSLFANVQRKFKKKTGRPGGTDGKERINDY